MAAAVTCGNGMRQRHAAAAAACGSGIRQRYEVAAATCDSGMRQRHAAAACGSGIRHAAAAATYGSGRGSGMRQRHAAAVAAAVAAVAAAAEAAAAAAGAAAGSAAVATAVNADGRSLELRADPLLQETQRPSVRPPPVRSSALAASSYPPISLLTRSPVPRVCPLNSPPARSSAPSVHRSWRARAACPLRRSLQDVPAASV